MTKIMESLRSISFYKIDRSTQLLDPEALDGGLSTGSPRIRSFQILAH